MVGVVEAMAEPWLPFFISYARESGRSPLPESTAGVPDRLAWIEVAGDAARLREWARRRVAARAGRRWHAWLESRRPRARGLRDRDPVAIVQGAA
jgi:hypothetical protein